MTAIITLIGLGVAPATPAFATPSKPYTDYSYYMLSSSTTNAYNIGCNQGKNDKNAGNPSRLDFIDFGGQTDGRTGTKEISGVVLSNGTVEHIAEQFAYGYWVCTGSDTSAVLNLAIGTNNSYYGVNSSGGATWAGVVNTVASWVSSHAGQVSVWGGDDIEPSWSTHTDAIDWANGFASHTSTLYLNYGSADGCPQYSSGNGGCNNGWNQYDVWYMSWGAAPAVTTPEIYYSSQGREWTQICLYGKNHQGSEMYFKGPLDEHDLNSGTYSESGAWSDLWNDLHATSCAQTPYYSVEVHNE